MGSFDVTQALLERALSGAALRQTALANNIANANTAGFKRSDVDFASALASALDDGASKQQLDAVDFAPVVDGTGGRADGNNVDIDREMELLAEANLTYSALTQVMAARIGVLKNVISGR